MYFSPSALLLMARVATACPGVPEGYEQRGQNTYYKAVSSPQKNHGNAKAICEADSAHLAYFRHSEEENNMWYYINGKRKFLITIVHKFSSNLYLYLPISYTSV